MRVRTWSACVVLAWGILLIITAAGPLGSFGPAQATTRIASITSSTDNKTINTSQATLTSSVTTTMSCTSAGQPASAPARRTGTGSYVIQPGDTLSGIAAALGTPGGWPALYAANRGAIGADPGLIRQGTALVLPGRSTPDRYAVGPGDTLSGIATALGTPGGWPALYAANRRAIGPNPDAIRSGTVLEIPHPASAEPPASHRPPSSPTRTPASQPASTPARTPASAQPSARGTAPPAGGPASAQPSTGTQPHPRSAQPLSMGGLPRWLEIVLVAAGLLIAIAFLTEPVLAIARRRRVARPAATDAHIVLADYERLVVTHSRDDGTVYVLRPPGADPQAILLAARLVLAQDRYEALAGHLGVPAHWPRE
jgi:LysM repeat protein